MGIIAFIVIALLAGIFYLEAQSQSKKKPREQFLEELSQALEGRIEPMVDIKNSFRVSFTFNDKNFIFEDIEDEGFRETLYKAFLRVKTDTKFNLSFAEKKVRSVIRPDMIMTSQIPDEPFVPEVKLDLPNQFRSFETLTNNVEIVNKLFKNTKLLPFFLECRNVDSRGWPFMTFKIVDGFLILEFQAFGSAFPSLSVLYKDVRIMKNYLNPMCTIVDILNRKDIPKQKTST